MITPKQPKNSNYTLHYTAAQFPACCGIQLLTGIYWAPTATKSPSNNWEQLCDSANNNTLILTTSSSQTRENAYLEACEGWTKTELPDNPNTGNALYLWIYTKKELLECRDDDDEWEPEEDEDPEY